MRVGLCLVGGDEVVARNLARQLTAFATGVPVRFSDRGEIENIWWKTKGSGYGLRELIHLTVERELFLEQVK